MKLDDIKKLHQKKYRTQFGCYLVEGEHLLLELEKTSQEHCEILVTEQHQDWPTRFQKTLISGKKMATISDTKSPQGIVAVVPFESLKAPASSKAIYLYEVQDPGNLGTILRTLGWFGGYQCILSPGCVDPYNPKVVRSSMGAIFHVDIEQDVTLEQLQQRFPRIATLDMNGSRLSEPSFGEFDCYLFGNEARGVPNDQLSGFDVSPYTIAGNGAIESLNLATAVNMTLYELHR
ncbi:RNA methyltransferase [Bacterioplanoides sp. SCSIO 12839]|uniref:RNA methyltransferase n=1 Tax=Bacterioplanoides sp. SCSIO 12839 TaxID=2829569 RepID=UPI002104A53F|nr:RNA methyltransferase [Bacterioplanoides sp. SCSIO 12839]UTW47970.1 RNA methyltransferase [Bacterioplanoides sp. SCSIO 12839]